MKYALQCAVKSLMKLPKPVTLDWAGKEVSFFPNADGWLSEIRIVAPVVDPSLVSAKLQLDPEIAADPGRSGPPS
jgi:hypothetical protein